MKFTEYYDVTACEIITDLNGSFHHIILAIVQNVAIALNKLSIICDSICKSPEQSCKSKFSV